MSSGVFSLCLLRFTLAFFKFNCTRKVINWSNHKCFLCVFNRLKIVSKITEGEPFCSLLYIFLEVSRNILGYDAFYF